MRNSDSDVVDDVDSIRERYRELVLQKTAAAVQEIPVGHAVQWVEERVVVHGPTSASSPLPAIVQIVEGVHR